MKESLLDTIRNISLEKQKCHRYPDHATLREVEDRMNLSDAEILSEAAELEEAGFIRESRTINDKCFIIRNDFESEAYENISHR